MPNNNRESKIGAGTLVAIVAVFILAFAFFVWESGSRTHVASNPGPSGMPESNIVNQAPPPASSPLFNQALLYAPSLEKAGVGRVLLDVGGLTLFCGVHFTFYLRHSLVNVSMISRSLVTAISRRHGRHSVVA
jgi:hypothetical protein